MIKNKSRFILMILLITVGFTLISCNKSTVKNEETDIVSSLYQYKSNYIGDNSNASSLVELLPYAEYKKGIELSTTEKPYGMKVIYELKDSSVNVADMKTEFYNNALIIFSLIENVDYVDFAIETEGNLEQDSTKFDRASIQENGIDNLFVYSKDLETFDNFLYEKVYKSADA